MFNLGWFEIVALVVIALLVFGPDKLPQAAAQAGKTLRNLKRMASSAREDLRAGLGPEFADFDPTDLNPRNFVRKHLLEEDGWQSAAPAAAQAYEPLPALEPELRFGEIPPYDHEAT